MKLSGKTALVTGAASGFGKGIAARFAAEGAEVIVADIHADAARDVAEEIGGRAVHCDVSRAESVAQMAQELAESGVALDILVNNAGTTHQPGPLDTISEQEFDRVCAVNMKSVFLTAQAFVPGFKARRRGSILNVASTAGVSPRPNLNWYNASKGWMITATKTMAIELAPFGIRVNAINPVAGETPLLKTFMGEDTPERRAQFLATIPLGRFSTPEDMGHAACFLVSDDAAMITGVAMEVDGGRCI